MGEGLAKCSDTKCSIKGRQDTKCLSFIKLENLNFDPSSSLSCDVGDGCVMYV